MNSEQLMKLDPLMLLSIINMKLRDFYPTLASLCDDLGLDETALKSKLASIGYYYDDVLNQFKP